MKETDMERQQKETTKPKKVKVTKAKKEPKTKPVLRNMLSPQIYEAAFSKYFRIPRYGTNKFVVFDVNKMQREVLYNMDYSNIILKARKEGFSTLILAMAILNCNEIPNYKAVFLAHTDTDTQNIFSRATDIVYNVSGMTLDVELTKDGIYFKRTNSTIKTYTAGSKGAGRGGDAHFIHFSELAFYAHPDVYSSILSSSNIKNVIVFMESTAKGKNLFYDLWTKAQDYPNK